MKPFVSTQSFGIEADHGMLNTSSVLLSRGVVQSSLHYEATLSNRGTGVANGRRKLVRMLAELIVEDYLSERSSTKVSEEKTQKP